MEPKMEMEITNTCLLLCSLNYFGYPQEYLEATFLTVTLKILSGFFYCLGVYELKYRKNAP